MDTNYDADGEESSFADDENPVPPPPPNPNNPQRVQEIVAHFEKLYPNIYPNMASLSVRLADRQSVREKAMEDARQMQQIVVETANKAKKDPPKYVLVELIGKGSFGRVYKAKDMSSARIVAVKIIDLDESDTVNPRQADTYSEFMREVNALKTLSDSKAKNINHVIEALPVGKAMWMVTEHCAGGSVATLMKPTAPNGLDEQWIIPILRELAEAIKWVHQAGIIHRDIKCANVLITEEGGVQLCDFGVSGMLENKVDKRTTMVGTPHWMAPELFEASPSYGKEVDIWAFGAMAYELATGLPPNVLKGITTDKLGSYLKQNVPRLEGGKYSSGLRSIIAFCMEENPTDRPAIEDIQKHSYIYNTSTTYPASSLANLVRAFKGWEEHGGSRKSLFMRGGAQGPPEIASTALSDDVWNFSTTAAFDESLSDNNSLQAAINVYGAGALNGDFSEETTKAISKPSGREKGRRRPPPEALAPLKAPLEKIFDPNTISNYEDNSRVHYGRGMPEPASGGMPQPAFGVPQPAFGMPQPASDLPLRDLPLRDNSSQSSVRESRIDLGGHDIETGLSSFPDLATIRAGRRDDSDDYVSDLPDFNRPPRSDPAENKNNRRTQDWKFPSMSIPMSADPELSRFPDRQGPDGRPALIHHQTEPIGSLSLMVSEPNSPNRMSLIDLDLGLGLPELPRPSTASSDVGSSTSEVMSATNPFDLERHTSLYRPESTMIDLDAAEPSNYMSSAAMSTTSSFSEHERERSETPSQLMGPASIPSHSASSSTSAYAETGENMMNGTTAPPYASTRDRTAEIPRVLQPSAHISPAMPFDLSHFPDLPAPPSVAAMTGTADREEMLSEFSRLFAGLQDQLGAFRDVYSTLPTRRGPPPPPPDRR